MAASSSSWLSETSNILIVLGHHENEMKTISCLMSLGEKFDSLSKSENQQEFDQFIVDLITWGFVALLKEILKEKTSALLKQIILDLLVKITGNSRKFCKNVIDNHFHNFLTFNLNLKTFQKKYTDSDEKEEKICDHIRKVLIILRNIFRNCPELRLSFCKTNVKHTLRELLEADSDDEIKTSALLCLSYVVDFEADDDLHLLTLQKKHLDFLFQQVLPNILRTSDRLSYESFQVDEIMESLSIFSRNSQTATELIKQGIISICETYVEEFGFLLNESITYFCRFQRTARLALSVLNQISMIPRTGFLFNIEDPIVNKETNSSEIETFDVNACIGESCLDIPAQSEEILMQGAQTG